MNRVLFVCIENSNRSQMAEAFAHMLGGAKVDAKSAGSRPSGKINSKAIRFMAELGYDLTTHESKSLDRVTGEFDAVITMGCGDNCPWIPARQREDWALYTSRWSKYAVMYYILSFYNTCCSFNFLRARYLVISNEINPAWQNANSNSIPTHFLGSLIPILII